MMNTFLLAAGVAGATGFWIVNRWADRSGALMEAYRFWMVLFSMLFSAPLVWLFGESLRGTVLWTCGTVVAIAYVGCIGVMMYGLKHGPSGPVVASNNMGLLWPVLVSIAWLDPRQPSAALYIGIVAVCAALVILGLSSNSNSGQRNGDGDSKPLPPGKWAATLLLLWTIAGVSMATQTVSAVKAPGVPAAFVFVLNLVALVIVAPLFLMKTRFRVRRCELVPGIVQGGVQVGSMVVIYMAIPRIGAETVFPFVVASPIILMLLVGHFVFHERLTRPAVAGCLLGTVGLVLLAVS